MADVLIDDIKALNFVYFHAFQQIYEGNAGITLFEENTWHFVKLAFTMKCVSVVCLLNDFGNHSNQY